MHKHGSEWTTNLKTMVVFLQIPNHEANLPAFSSTPKRSRQPSISTAISGASIASTKALGGRSRSRGCCAVVSPGKVIELRMKIYKQLLYLQKLLEDVMLSRTEYSEQKEAVLGSLRKL